MPEKTKKNEPKKFMIQCTKSGAPKGSAQLFQLNGMNYYVPFNKAVLVPEWVYILWLDSDFNSEREVTRGVDEEHLVHDDDPYR